MWSMNITTGMPSRHVYERRPDFDRLDPDSPRSGLARGLGSSLTAKFAILYGGFAPTTMWEVPPEIGHHGAHVLSALERPANRDAEPDGRNGEWVRCGVRGGEYRDGVADFSPGCG
jgi:hypothetical protein